MLGPGARNGLMMMFDNEKMTATQMLERSKKLQREQLHEFKKMHIEFPFWQGKEISLKNIEHALCEFSRYRRLQAHQLKKKSAGPVLASTRKVKLEVKQEETK